MKFKYKPGDVVIVDPKGPVLSHLRGKPVTIKAQTHSLAPFLGPYYEFEEVPDASLPESCITGYAAREEKVVITTDGYRTTARLYNGKNLLRTTEAKCNPEDTFDFETGARLVFSRLFPTKDSSPKPAEPKPKYAPMQQLRIRAGTRIHHHIRPGSVVTVLAVLTNHIYRVTGPATFCNGHVLQSVHKDDLSPL